MAHERTVDSMFAVFLLRTTILYVICGCGGIGRRARFRFWCLRRAGSSPVIRSAKCDKRNMAESRISLIDIKHSVFSNFLFVVFTLLLSETCATLKMKKEQPPKVVSL